MNPKVDAFVGRAKKWQEELKKLRTILLGCHLTEELKWGKPCYAFEGGNIAIITPMKETCALAFMKGALLKDPEGILVRPGENSQSGRWIKFTSVKEIGAMQSVLKAYIKEAIEIEKAGLEVKLKETSEFEVPEELTEMMKEDPSFKAAFEALTPGRQRGYLLFFNAPKQAKTRVSRIEKSLPRILDGKGVHDR